MTLMRTKTTKHPTVEQEVAAQPVHNAEAVAGGKQTPSGGGKESISETAALAFRVDLAQQLTKGKDVLRSTGDEVGGSGGVRRQGGSTSTFARQSRSKFLHRSVTLAVGKVLLPPSTTC